MSLNDIGKEFGDRDHSTILHSLDKVESTMRSDPAFAEKVKEITTNINSKKRESAGAGETERKGRVFPIFCVIHVESLCIVRNTHEVVGNPAYFP